jgi:heme oxygenase
MISDPPRLTERLRAATADLHRTAERSGIINDLLTGRADRTGFTALLHNLLPVYEALEAGLERHRGQGLLRSLARREVYRATALRDDLVRLGGSPQILPEAGRYAARVVVAASGEGATLMAFAYVRYIGDLSGGQTLSRLISRSLNLSPPAFYHFADIEDLPAFREEYRQAIDHVGAGLSDASSIIAAAQEAFQLDIALSLAISRSPPSHPP